MGKKNEVKKQADTANEGFFLDFSKISFKGLSGKPVVINFGSTPLHETLGDALFRGTAGMQGFKLAERVYDCKGGKVELSKIERQVMLLFLQGDRCDFTGIVIKALLEQLESDIEKK